MTSFVQWLHDQEKREGDPVGWFAVFWKNLDGKPRLSSPASIAKYLEDNQLFQDTNGLTEAYDATLSEYRKFRAGIVHSAASAEGIQLPLPEHQPGEEPPEQGLAGQAVARATEAAVQAAQGRGITISTPVTDGMSQLDHIEAKLDDVMSALAYALDYLDLLSHSAGVISMEMADRQDTERIVNVVSRVLDARRKGEDLAASEDLPWAEWHQQAVVYALAHGPDWDREEA